MVTEARRRKVERVASQRQEGVVVLEDIVDPHNAAAVLRSCDAFGIQRICYVFEQVEPYEPKRIGKGTSASANKWLDLTVHRSLEACLRELKDGGYSLLATVVDEGAESLLESEIQESRVALLLGNEHRGLSPKAVELADRKLTIPMAGMVESLNLSVTAGIFLFELARQRHRRGVGRYLMPRGERERLKRSLLEP